MRAILARSSHLAVTLAGRRAHAPFGASGWLLPGDSTPPADAGMASTEARRECETQGCSKDAKLQCPTCIKLGIQGSYFCSQVGSAAYPTRPPRRSAADTGPGPRRFNHEAASSCQARWCSVSVALTRWTSNCNCRQK